MADGRPRRLCLTWGLVVCLGWMQSGASAQTRRKTYLRNPDPLLLQVEAAADLINRGQRAAGIHRLQAVLKRKPTQRQALEVLAEVYLRDQRQQEAAELLARCVKKHSYSWRCRTIQGRMLLAQGDVKRAVATLKKAVTANTSDAKAYFHLGRGLLRQNKLDRAEIAFNRALAYRKAGNAVGRPPAPGQDLQSSQPAISGGAGVGVVPARKSARRQRRTIARARRPAPGRLLRQPAVAVKQIPPDSRVLQIWKAKNAGSGQVPHPSCEPRRVQANPLPGFYLCVAAGASATRPAVGASYLWPAGR